MFSGSCLSLDGVDVHRPRLVERRHELGPGFDLFDEEGRPTQPPSRAHCIHKIFSGSALDLNAAGSEEEVKSPRQNPVRHPVDGSLSTMLEKLSSESEKERDRQIRSRTTVLVVGGAGYVGSHVTAQLLEAGYTVRCAVPTSQLNQHVSEDLHLMVPEANRRLTVTEIDLTDMNSFREVMKGCVYVVHTGVASVQDRGDIVNVHVEAAKTLFDAIRCFSKSTVRRVILTGSSTTVFHPSDVPPDKGGFNEEHWNTKASSNTEPFHFAKVAFEKEAWRLHKMVGVELVVVIPSIVLGPSHTTEVSEGMRTLSDLCNSSPFFPFAPPMYWNFVDVRDVAAAHVLAMENDAAAGQRFIVSAGCFSLSEIGSMAKKSYPHLHPPHMNAPWALTMILGPATNARVSMRYLWNNLCVRRPLDSTKIQTVLGAKVRSMEVTVADSIKSLIDEGYLPRPGLKKKGSVESSSLLQSNQCADVVPHHQRILLTLNRCASAVLLLSAASYALYRWRDHKK